jgi:Kef-type K+ transport system membrane component KefB
VSFGTLVVIVLAGLGGPLLALSERHFVPVVIGEIIAGVVVGRTGLGVVDPANATVSFLGQVGFEMVMLTVGMQLPLRDPRLADSLRGGAVLAAIVGVLAVPAGLAAAALGALLTPRYTQCYSRLDPLRCSCPRSRRPAPMGRTRSR